MQRKVWKMAAASAALLGTGLLSGCDSRYVVLNPAGPVGRTELHLIELSTILVSIVVIPVLVLLAYIVYRFRDKPGSKAPYAPEWADSKVLEYIWWGIPIVIVAVLGIATAKDTFTLTKPPVKDVTPITIQVTSLDWKWLFQYPGQNIATVNYCEIPVGVPVNFVLTADAPVNSFWVPELGGQEYAMPGMDLTLWLQADKPGDYFGTGANFTGKGFAHMQFNVVAKSQAEFDSWVNGVKQNSPALTKDGYDKLAVPGTVGKLEYSSIPPGLYEETVNKNGGIYMPHKTSTGQDAMPGMNMGK